MTTSSLRLLLAREDERAAWTTPQGVVALRARLWQALGGGAAAAPPLRHGAAEPATDHERIVAVRNGSRVAFDELVAPHLAALVHYAARHVGPASAEDAVQEALLELWRKRETLPSDLRNVRAYLLGCVRLRVLTVLRQDAARREEAVADLEPAVGSDALEHVLTAETNDRIAEALACACNALEQEVLLAFVEGLDAAAVARRLDLTANHVRVLKHRATAKVQARLGGRP